MAWSRADNEIRAVNHCPSAAAEDAGTQEHWVRGEAKM
jgi:hypothetical protein